MNFESRKCMLEASKKSGMANTIGGSMRMLSKLNNIPRRPGKIIRANAKPAIEPMMSRIRVLLKEITIELIRAFGISEVGNCPLGKIAMASA